MPSKAVIKPVEPDRSLTIGKNTVLIARMSGATAQATASGLLRPMVFGTSSPMTIDM